MPNNWNIALYHYNITTTTITNITDNFISLPLATDTGNDEINTAKLVLSAPDGKFITVAPLLKQFDRIRIQILDDGGFFYNKVFDIMKIIPSWTKSEGLRITLILHGIEHWLQKINHIKPFNYEGAFEVVRDIGNSYNNSRGSTQPSLTGHNSTSTNKLPSANYQKNNYDFAVSEAPCFDRLGDVIDKLGGSVDNGGILDFYDCKFNSDISSYTTMEMNVFSSGSPTDGSEVTINESTATNVGETDGGIDAIGGTIVNAWGAVDQGTLPIEISQYSSKTRRLDFMPYWIGTESYKTGSVVKYGNALYVALQNSVNQNPASTIGVFWNVKTTQEWYNGIVYSPWTHGIGVDGSPTANGHQYWKDSGTSPVNTVSGNRRGNGFYDGNVIIWDDTQNYFRTKVDIILTTINPTPSDITGSVTLKKYLYNDTTFYRGFTVLLKNTTTSNAWSLSGTSTTDKNGKSYSQAVLQYNGTEWVVKYLPSNNISVMVRDLGTIHIYTGGNWVEQSYLTEHDCIHPYNSIGNSTGIPITSFSPNTNSAVTVGYDFSSPPLTDGTHWKCGAWLNLSFPFPSAKISHSTVVGTLYGGAVTGRDAVCEPATLDTQNMHLTHDGYRGFNNGISSEDFGQISSVDFWMKIHYQGKVGLNYYTITSADYKMRCLMIDTSDNVVYQDFTLPFSNHWEQIKLPISGFTVYRGRKPANTVLEFVTPPKEIKILNSFEFKNIKNIIIQTQDSYDDDGRYNYGTDNRFVLDIYPPINHVPTFPPMPPIIEKRIELSIDAFHFTKPLLVNTGADTTRCLEGDFIERPEIMDYYQLKNDADAELQKRKFQHIEYDISTTGKCDINFGDYFFYENSKLIPTEFETLTDKIKLVAKHIEYSITKPVDGKGGFLRRILGVRRF